MVTVKLNRVDAVVMHAVRYNDVNVDLATATPLRDTLAGDSSVARSLLARSLLFLGSSALLDIEERNGRERPSAAPEAARVSRWTFNVKSNRSNHCGCGCRRNDEDLCRKNL